VENIFDINLLSNVTAMDKKTSISKGFVSLKRKGLKEGRRRHMAGPPEGGYGDDEGEKSFRTRGEGKDGHRGINIEV
jgi:hypothetical protein